MGVEGHTAADGENDREHAVVDGTVASSDEGLSTDIANHREKPSLETSGPSKWTPESPAVAMTDHEEAPRRLAPASKIVVSTDPSASLHKSHNGVAPSSEPDAPTAEPYPPALEPGLPPPKVDEGESTSKEEVTAKVDAAKAAKCTLGFAPISPGLSNIRLPLGLKPDAAAKVETDSMPVSPPKEEPVEAKVGDIVEMSFGRGQVRQVREDGMLEIEAMGWEMSGEQRARYFFRRDAVKVVPTVYYKMPVLERLQSAAWLKEEGTRLFKEASYDGAAERYMKAIGVLKTGEFNTNAHNARALEIMIPCHNNAATCYLKLKVYKDARLLAENVDTLCSALERNRGGLVMKALKARGVAEIKVLGHWWCKGLFLGGKACLFQGENEEAVTCFKKASKIAKPTALANLRSDITPQLELATKRSANQKAKAQKMWNKAFKKNSTQTTPEATPSVRESPSVSLTPKTDILQRLQELVQSENALSEPQDNKSNGDEAEGESDSEYGDEETEGIESQGWGLGTALTVGALATAGVVGAFLLSRRR